MSCFIPRSDDKLPTSPKKGWKHLRRIFRSFKNSDDYYNNYYQFHVHYDDYKKKQGPHGCRSLQSVDHKAAAAVSTSLALSSTRERARGHRIEDEERRKGRRNGLRECEENGEPVDADCQEFIEQLREKWKIERQISHDEFLAMLERSA